MKALVCAALAGCAVDAQVPSEPWQGSPRLYPLVLRTADGAPVLARWLDIELGIECDRSIAARAGFAAGDCLPIDPPRPIAWSDPACTRVVVPVPDAAAPPPHTFVHDAIAPGDTTGVIEVLYQDRGAGAIYTIAPDGDGGGACRPAGTATWIAAQRYLPEQLAHAELAVDADAGVVVRAFADGGHDVICATADCANEIDRAGRLWVQWRVDRDRRAQVGVFDSDAGAVCEIRSTVDGTLRCLPRATWPAPTTRFADPGCSAAIDGAAAPGAVRIDAVDGVVTAVAIAADLAGAGATYAHGLTGCVAAGSPWFAMSSAALDGFPRLTVIDHGPL